MELRVEGARELAAAAPAARTIWRTRRAVAKAERGAKRARWRVPVSLSVLSHRAHNDPAFQPPRFRLVVCDPARGWSRRAVVGCKRELGGELIGMNSMRASTLRRWQLLSQE